MIVPGLEKALTGRNVGDKFSVDVAPKEGYGEYNSELVDLTPLTKRPYKIYFWYIPYFMRVRKRFVIKKNQKNWMKSWDLGHFFGALVLPKL